MPLPSPTEEPGRPQSMGCKESDMTEATEHACLGNNPYGQRTGKQDVQWESTYTNSPHFLKVLSVLPLVDIIF